MLCPTAWGQWAAQLLQCAASLPGGSGQWNSRNTPPHCLGGVGSATPAMHCLTVWGQWAVERLQYTAPLPGGSGQCNTCNALPHCLGAVRSATPAMHCLAAWGQWAVPLLQCTALPPGGSGQCNPCNALPHWLGAVGSATPAMHCLTALGRWAVQLLQCTASLPGGNGQCNSCNALPHCLGEVDSGTPAMQCNGQRSVVGVSCRACGDEEPGTAAWGTGSTAQGLVGVSRRACGEEESGTPAWGDGESCPGGGRSVLQGLWGCRFGHTSLGGRGVPPRGWSECIAGPVGRQIRAHRPGGTGSSAQGVVGASCRVYGDVEPGTPAWGDGESSPGGGRSFLQGLRGWTTGHTGLGGWGVLPRGWSECPAGPAGR